MAIKGRTQLSIHITDTHFAALQAIKEDTGLSNAKIVEMLIDYYVSSDKTVKPTKTTSTKTKPEPTSKYVTEERVKELIQEALFSSRAATVETEEEKEKKRIEKLNEIIRQNTDEHGNFDALATGESIDTSPPIPEWDEQAWLDEDFMVFSDDPNPPEIIRPKTPIEDEDDDW